MEFTPVGESLVNKNQTITVMATSSEGKEVKTCQEDFTFTYQYANDSSIIPTGISLGYKSRTVDSPDELVLPLRYDFYGSDISYEIGF
jgi:hypothetical protein